MKISPLFIFIAILSISACGTRPDAMDEPDGYFYWNPARPIKIFFPDRGATNQLQAVLRQGTNRFILGLERNSRNETGTELSLTLPAGAVMAKTPENCSLTVERKGTPGPNVLTNLAVIIDTEPPQASIVASSPDIVKGGAAMVIVRASDAHLRYPSIVEPGAGKFFTQPYRRDGYFIGMMVWPVTQKWFSPVVITEDRAGNATTNSIPVTVRNFRYPVSDIPVDNEFKNDKLDEVGSSNTNAAIGERERYDLIMQGFQKKKDADIVGLTSVRIRDRFESPGRFQPFDPVPSAMITSPYGEHRQFLMNGAVVRDSYHFGLDMAKVSNSEIFVSTEGTVIYRGYNGANGNMVLIHHGLGIYSLYAHCSKLFVNPNDRVYPGQRIALSGKTGYALGDHLHFGIIIQGRSSNPLEWMDKAWLKENIQDVSRKADERIVGGNGN